MAPESPPEPEFLDVLTAPANYEAFYGLGERPFSLTADARFHFQSRAHARAADLLAFGFRRQEGLLLITGDAGMGKTILARALVAEARRRVPAAFIPHPLVTPEDLLRLVFQEIAGQSARDVWAGRLSGATRGELHEALAALLDTPDAGDGVATIVIDEAHRVPPPILAEIVALDGLEVRGRRVFQIVLAGASAAGTAASLANHQLDQRIVTRARLLPLEREETADYVAFRLRVAGAALVDLFVPRAVEALHDLSGGVPRLVNLIAERALQEGALIGASRIAPHAVERAAIALDIRHARPRRFRWFDR